METNRRDFMKTIGIGLVGLIGINNSEAKERVNQKWKICEKEITKSKNPCGEVLVGCYDNNCSVNKKCPYYN